MIDKVTIVRIVVAITAAVSFFPIFAMNIWRGFVFVNREVAAYSFLFFLILQQVYCLGQKQKDSVRQVGKYYCEGYRVRK